MTAKETAALKRLEGKKVEVRCGESWKCTGELQWSRELQKWAVVRDDRDWRDRIEFATADLKAVHVCRGVTRSLPTIVLHRAMIATGARPIE